MLILLYQCTFEQRIWNLQHKKKEQHQNNISQLVSYSERSSKGQEKKEAQLILLIPSMESNSY